VLSVAALCTAPAFSQFPQVRLSPREHTSETLAGKNVEIAYGRPYRRGRKIFGNGLPYGKLWRTGADEATTLSTDATLTVGRLTVAPGDYSLFTIPNMDHWTLVINTDPNLLGRNGYNRKKDLGRVDMAVERTPEMVEQLTIEIAKTTENSGILRISWETTLASVPILTK
jgi:hypothetical protein